MNAIKNHMIYIFKYFVKIRILIVRIDLISSSGLIDKNIYD